MPWFSKTSKIFSSLIRAPHYIGSLKNVQQKCCLHKHFCFTFMQIIYVKNEGLKQLVIGFPSNASIKKDS